LLPIQESEGEWQGGGGVWWSLTPAVGWLAVVATAGVGSRGRKTEHAGACMKVEGGAGARRFASVSRWSVGGTAVASARCGPARRWLVVGQGMVMK